jgi:hypothetical protein
MPGRCSRAVAPAAALLVAALVAGCGGDDEKATGAGTGTSPATPPTRTVTIPARTTPKRKGSGAPAKPGSAPAKPGKKKPASPEDRPGGAGDAEPVRSEVVLTGRGGRIGPLLVKVPPFVSIRVRLRSADGKPYLLQFGRRVVKAGLKGARSSVTLDGLRPGRRLVGAAVSGKVVIEASAEPGP